MIDRTTGLLNAACQVLTLSHPLRTSVGVIVGVVLGTIVDIFNPYLNQFSAVIDFSNVSIWQFMIFGILILHVPIIFSLLVNRQEILDENVEKAFAVINEAKKRGVSKRQIGDMYLEICAMVLKNIELKQTTKDEIKEILFQPQRSDDGS